MALLAGGRIPHPLVVVYFFRVRREGDEWIAKRGARVLGRYDTMVDALDVASAEAAMHAPSELLYHGEDGEVLVVGRYPLDETDGSGCGPA